MITNGTALQADVETLQRLQQRVQELLEEVDWLMETAERLDRRIKQRRAGLVVAPG